MTALTPGCDPDMSVTGAPFGTVVGRGPRVRSALVLVAVVALAALLATAGSVPGLVAVPALVVGVLSALVLLRRGIRLAHRSRPVPSATR